MGQKRGRAEGSFVRETRAQAVTFYRDLVQNLKAWQVRPPQIRAEPDPPASEPASPPDILPLLPDDRMLPRAVEGDRPELDVADQLESNREPSNLSADSASRGVDANTLGAAFSPAPDNLAKPAPASETS